MAVYPGMRPLTGSGAIGVTLILGLIVSCAQPGSPAPDVIGPGRHEITVRASGLPDTYSMMDVVWKVVWWNGRTVETARLPSQPAVDPVEISVSLSRAGAEVVVVLATPLPEGGGALTPLGGWVAAPEPSITVEPSFGRAAEVVLQVARRGLDPSLVNLKRLHRTVIEECDGQPESLDRQRLLEGLGTGAMNRYAIRRRTRPGHEISLPAPRNDVWISHDTTEETITGVWAENRCYWVIPVAVGEVRHLWQWVPVDTFSQGNATVVPTVRLLTVGRDRDGHAFWFIKEV